MEDGLEGVDRRWSGAFTSDYQVVTYPITISILFSILFIPFSVVSLRAFSLLLGEYYAGRSALKKVVPCYWGQEPF